MTNNFKLTLTLAIILVTIICIQVVVDKIQEENLAEKEFEEYLINTYNNSPKTINGEIIEKTIILKKPYVQEFYFTILKEEGGREIFEVDKIDYLNLVVGDVVNFTRPPLNELPEEIDLIQPFK